MADDFTIQYLGTDPSGGGTTQTLSFRFAVVDDFKGMIWLDYLIQETTPQPKNVEQVAGIEHPVYVFLYYNDDETVTVVVSNLPQGASFNLTLKGTSGSLVHEATGSGSGNF